MAEPNWDSLPPQVKVFVEPLWRLLRADADPRTITEWPQPDHDGPRADLLVCANKLQALAEPEIDRAVSEIRASSDKAVFIVSTTFSDIVLPDGANAHQTIRDRKWWAEKLKRHFPALCPIPISEEFTAAFTTWQPSAKAMQALAATDQRIRRRETFRRSIRGRANTPRLLFSRFLREDAMMQTLDGKRVAIAGNAHSLANGEAGAAIDAADLVVRFNRAPILHTRSHGSRTDWIATGIPLTPETIAQRGASALVWCAALHRLPGWMYGRRDLFLYPSARRTTLGLTLGAKASTGFMMIDMVARSKAARVQLFGFDFFQTLSSSGHRNAREVPHDFAAEQEKVRQLLRDDHRFSLG